MQQEPSEACKSNRESDCRANGKHGKKRGRRMFEFFSLHPKGIILFAVIILLLSGLVNFPGGDPRQLWWTCGGVCLLAVSLIIWGFSVFIAWMMPPVHVASPLPSPPATQVPPRDDRVSSESLAINPPPFGFQYTGAIVRFGDEGVTSENIHMNKDGTSEKIWNNSFVGGPRVVCAYALNHVLQVSCVCWDGDRPVEIKNNKIQGHPRWSANHDPQFRVIEYVNANHNPMLQLFYLSDHEIVIRGAFSNDGVQGLMLVQAGVQCPIPYLNESVKAWIPHFKYPAVQFPGVLLNDPKELPLPISIEDSIDEVGRPGTHSPTTGPNTSPLSMVKTARYAFDKWAIMKTSSEENGAEYASIVARGLHDDFISFLKHARPLIAMAKGRGIDAGPLDALFNGSSGNDGPDCRRAILVVLERLEARTAQEEHLQGG